MNIIEQLQQRGVIISDPNQIKIGPEVKIENIESEVVLQPGCIIQGEKTMLGRGTILGPMGVFNNVRCGRKVKLGQGYYENCVFLDGAETRFGSEMRGGTLFMEEAQAAHTVGCKMTILGIRVVLGSLINFCDVLVTGGTEESFGFTEIGSGTIHYNFTPNGLKFGSLIGPGVYGEMYGLFPKTFVGGQTQIISPTTIGYQSLIPAGTAVRQIVPDGVMSIEKPLSAGQKNYQPHLLTSVKEKFRITSLLISHYYSLYYYFLHIRKFFAKLQNDIFSQQLFHEAAEIIQLNIQERLRWLFSQTERNQIANFFGKLPQSLEIYQSELQQSSYTKIKFYLQQIKEHQTLLQQKDSLYQKLTDLCPELPEQEEFLNLCQKVWQEKNPKNYLEALICLPIEVKKVGQFWLQKLVHIRMESIQDILQKTQESLSIANTLKNMAEAAQIFFPFLKRIYEKNIYLFQGNWQSENISALNQNLNEYTDMEILGWQIFGQTEAFQLVKKGNDNPFINENWKCLFSEIENWPYPAVIHWPYLISMFLHISENDSYQSLIKRAIQRFHGTDGLRGTTVIYEKEQSIKDAIACFMQQHNLTPKFFTSLVRNSIHAYSILSGKRVEQVLIGCDPRDIYIDHPQHKNSFYNAVIEGALSAAKKILNVGVVPIPTIPYILSYLHNHENIPLKGISLAIYKTASHNPASQDGIKLFVEEVISNQICYIKASWELESIITALIFREAITQKFWAVENGECETNFNLVNDVLRQIMYVAQPNLANIAFLAIDLANGAFSQYQNFLEEIAKTNQIPNCVIVGNQPNGTNINNNHGEERVGAAHLENIHCIKRSEISIGGRFYGFPAIKALFDFGQQKQISLQDGITAWAIFTDGDGDRSYAALYNPFEDELHLIDGDEAFYHQIQFALTQGILVPGQTLAFTVESSVPFIQALISLVKKYHPVKMILSHSTPLDTDKINIKLCPVGDKHILRTQCFGVESSGHLVKPYQIKSTFKNSNSHTIFTGNGPMSGISTIVSIMKQLNNQNNKLPFSQRFQQVIAPYPKPYNNMLYIFFVKKQLWYRNSQLWKAVYEKIVAACFPHSLEAIDFLEEEDTLYLIGYQNSEWQFAILARPSGTENKFAIKFFGNPTHQELFDQISQTLYIQIAPLLKDYQLKICQDEQKILRILSHHPDTYFSLDHIASQILEMQTAKDYAYFMTIVESLSDKCQKLAYYDGSNLKIKERGILYLDRTK